MRPHLAEIAANGEQSPRASLLWRAKAVEIIKEHRRGTLDGEIEAILNICVDMYSMGLEDARDYMQHLASDNMAISLSDKVATVSFSQVSDPNSFSPSSKTYPVD